MPVPTLEGLAYNFWGSDRLICPIMDARRNQVYTGLYRFDEAGNLVTEMDQIPMDVNELIDLLLEKMKKCSLQVMAYRCMDLRSCQR